MIQCPKCGSKSLVVNTVKERPGTPYTWRSRTCKECRKTFSTREYSLEELAKLIDEGKESVVDLRSQCDDLLEDLAELITQYKTTDVKGN